VTAHRSRIYTLLCTTILLVGCFDRKAVPIENSAPNQTNVESNDQSGRHSVIASNDLFFDGIPTETGEPMDISPSALRGVWLALTPAGETKLKFGDPYVPSWTFDPSGRNVDNPDGSANLSVLGPTSSVTLPWGLESADHYGWISWPGAKEKRQLEFRLVRQDLLHLKGFTPARGGVQLDVILIRASLNPSASVSVSWNDYGLHRLTQLTDNELVDVKPVDDPTIRSNSPSEYRGQWVAQQNRSKVILNIADHRVLFAKREGGDRVDLATGEAPREWVWIVEYDADESCLRIKEHEAFLRLTKGGRLLYRHFGGQDLSGKGGRQIDILFLRAEH